MKLCYCISCDWIAWSFLSIRTEIIILFNLYCYADHFKYKASLFISFLQVFGFSFKYYCSECVYSIFVSSIIDLSFPVNCFSVECKISNCKGHWLSLSKFSDWRSYLWVIFICISLQRKELLLLNPQLMIVWVNDLVVEYLSFLPL